MRKPASSKASDGFAITLDDKPIRTPSGRQVVVPVRAIADAIAAEWEAQQEFIDPLTMPLTRFANSVVDAVVDRVEAVTDDVAKYFESDLLFYRAGHPEALVAREAAHWDPRAVLGGRYAGRAFHSRRRHRACPPAGFRDRGGARGAAGRSLVDRGPACDHDPDRLGAAGAWRCSRGVVDQDQVWAAAHVDEDWNIEKWGVDEEVAARRAARLVDFRAAARILEALNPRARLTRGLRQTVASAGHDPVKSSDVDRHHAAYPVRRRASRRRSAPVVLQPGTVISARVLQILTSDTVQIAIGSQPLDVLSQVPLQAGQTLQLAVSQTADGTVRLAVVNAQDGAPASPAPAVPPAPARYADTVTLAPAAAASIAPQAAPATVTPQSSSPRRRRSRYRSRPRPRRPSRPAWRRCLPISASPPGSQACRRRSSRRSRQVLAQQTSLDQNLTGNDIKQAFQSSGLFLEASLASGSVAIAGRRPISRRR